uniref:DUF4470 domain-containing protein n=1 Tax=Branchiostoma floridae TaxID=7739 RepID=C3YJZ8_BRAFL|eukprot:XP_002603444.1 hypothetical protein BRAFLDRAFT_80419 [Branchiostoma floridae]
MAILLAGDGNLRNVMATVAGLKQSFQGSIHFVLNDIDRQVMARNVLFLYILWKYKGEEKATQQLTQIWYSVKIGEEETTMVEECLVELLSLPDDTNMLCGGRVTMSAEQFSQLRPIFELWLSLLTGEKAMQKSPQEQLRLIYELAPATTPCRIDGRLNMWLLDQAVEDVRHEPDRPLWASEQVNNGNETLKLMVVCQVAGPVSVAEYYNNWDVFNQYLRAALLAHKCPESFHRDVSPKDVPKMSDVRNVSGMKMRNVLRELNTVCPFRYRINMRRVTKINAHRRALEWTLPESAD